MCAGINSKSCPYVRATAGRSAIKPKKTDSVSPAKLLAQENRLGTNLGRNPVRDEMRQIDATIGLLAEKFLQAPGFGHESQPAPEKAFKSIVARGERFG